MSGSTPHETRVFGAVILEQRKVIERLVGDEALEAGLQTLPAERADEYRNLSWLGWCRASTLSQLIEAIAVHEGRNPEQFIAEVVREGFGSILRGLWRFFMRFSSDEAIVRRAAMLYSKACDSGSLAARRIGPGHIELDLSDWDDIGPLDLVAIATGIETAMELVGRQELRLHWKPKPGGALFTVRSS